MIQSAKQQNKNRKPSAKIRPAETDTSQEVLRPRKFDEMVGRDQEKKTLRMMINAASKRGSVVDHILFHGPPGLGKTTFAMAIANELGSSLRITSGPAIEKQGDLAAILTSLKKGDVLFIDEIHRLSKTIEEVIYPVMEDGALDIVMGKGPSAKTVRLNIEPFTLVGATTQIGRISAPMRDRFGLVQRLEYYGENDLVEMIRRAARIETVLMDDEAIAEISKRSRGTARIALRLYKRVRDYMESSTDKTTIDPEVVSAAFELLGVDPLGLEHVDRKLLEIIYNHFDGGPVGLSTLAASISEDITTLSEVYEPFLLNSGLIKRTSRGRVLTSKGISYIQGNLWQNS